MYCVIQNRMGKNGYTRLDNMREKDGRNRGRNPGRGRNRERGSCRSFRSCAQRHQCSTNKYILCVRDVGIF